MRMPGKQPEKNRARQARTPVTSDQQPRTYTEMNMEKRRPGPWVSCGPTPKRRRQRRHPDQEVEQRRPRRSGSGHRGGGRGVLRHASRRSGSGDRPDLHAGRGDGGLCRVERRKSVRSFESLRGNRRTRWPQHPLIAAPTWSFAISYEEFTNDA